MPASTFLAAIKGVELVLNRLCDQQSPHRLGNISGKTPLGSGCQHLRDDILYAGGIVNFIAIGLDTRGLLDIALPLGHQIDERPVDTIDFPANVCHRPALYHIPPSLLSGRSIAAATL